jgi:hypothetical protein
MYQSECNNVNLVKDFMFILFCVGAFRIKGLPFLPATLKVFAAPRVRQL